MFSVVQQLLSPLSSLLLLLDCLLSLLNWTKPSHSYLLLLSHAILSLSQRSLSVYQLILLLLVYASSLSLLTPNNNLQSCNHLTRHAIIARSLITQLSRFFQYSPPRLILIALLLFRAILYFLHPNLTAYLAQALLLSCASPQLAFIRSCFASPPIQDNKCLTPSRSTHSKYHHHQINLLLVTVRLSITLIEHQRWRQDTGWSSELTARDKALIGGNWTDQLGREVPPRPDFRLPTSSSLQESWSWAKPYWTILRSPLQPSTSTPSPSNPELERWLVDQDGWTYGDTTWTSFTHHPGFHSFTRKRCWTRVALRSFSSDLSG